MEYSYGWTGKILRVDLTRGVTSLVETSKYLPQYVGGLGIGFRIAWEEIPKGTKAFAPENKVILMVGPLSGTAAPNSGRAVMCGVAPQSLPEQIANSSCGGWFPAKLKWAGYDGVIVEGEAPVPSYVLIGERSPQIVPAEDLWGLGVWDVQTELKKRHGDYTDAYCIGPAGEKLSRIASVETYTARGFGQGGFGGVWGSKNLKAICIDGGNHHVRVAHPEELLKLRAELSPKRYRSPLSSQDLSALTEKNKGFESLFVEQLDRVYTGPYQWRRKACSHGCSQSCYFFDFKEVPTATRPGTLTGEIGCMGVKFMQFHYKNKPPMRFRGSFEANMLCDQMGMNEYEVIHGFVPWLYRAKQMGLDIEDKLGMPIDVRSPEFWVKLLTMIANRQGLGDLMAEGLARTVAELGKEKYGDQIYTGPGAVFDDAQETRPLAALGGWGYTSREWLYELPYPTYLLAALNWMIDTRDPHHSKWLDLESTAMKSFSSDANPYLSKAGTKLAYEATVRGNLIDCLTVCWAFPLRDGWGWMYSHPRSRDDEWTNAESRLYSAVTGVETTEEELFKAGVRITTLHRAIQIRNNDRTAQVEWNEFMPGLRRIGVDESKFATMVANFYQLFGWDSETGWPTRATYESLGLKDVADKLGSSGKLPVSSA